MRVLTVTWEEQALFASLTNNFNTLVRCQAQTAATLVANCNSWQFAHPGTIRSSTEKPSAAQTLPVTRPSHHRVDVKKVQQRCSTRTDQLAELLCCFVTGAVLRRSPTAAHAVERLQAVPVRNTSLVLGHCPVRSSAISAKGLKQLGGSLQAKSPSVVCSLESLLTPARALSTPFRGPLRVDRCHSQVTQEHSMIVAGGALGIARNCCNCAYLCRLCPMGVPFGQTQLFVPVA